MFAFSAVIFAQASDRSDETNNPEIDNLSGLKPDIDDLAPDYGVAAINNNDTDIGTNNGNDDGNDVTLQDNNVETTRGNSIMNTTVFPNPATNNITIATEVEFGTIRILNLLGQEINSYSIQSNSTNLDITELNEGIYFISVESGEQKVVKKLKVLY